MEIHDHRRPGMDAVWQAGIGPGGIAVRAGMVARPLVAGPRAQADAGRQAVGCIFSRAGKERCCAVVLSIVYNEFQKLFYEFLYSFDEFHLDLISTQIEPTRYLCRD
jgi:hypothetical protein